MPNTDSKIDMMTTEDHVKRIATKPETTKKQYFETLPVKHIINIVEDDKCSNSGIRQLANDRLKELAEIKLRINETFNTGQQLRDITKSLKIEIIRQMLDGATELELDDKVKSVLQETHDERELSLSSRSTSSRSIPNLGKSGGKVNKGKTDAEPYIWYKSPFSGFMNTITCCDLDCISNKKDEMDLRYAARDGKIEGDKGIKSLLKKGVNINGRGFTDSFCALWQDFYDKTPLMIAVIHNRFDAVKLLVKLGAVLDLLDQDGCNAMDYAIKKNNEGIKTYLSAQGARPAKSVTTVTNPVEMQAYRS